MMDEIGMMVDATLKTKKYYVYICIYPRNYVWGLIPILITFACGLNPWDLALNRLNTQKYRSDRKRLLSQHKPLG